MYVRLGFDEPSQRLSPCDSLVIARAAYFLGNTALAHIRIDRARAVETDRALIARVAAEQTARMEQRDLRAVARR